jgi:hypothetical protein
MKLPARSASSIDYALYAGRWIAIVRDRVAGVGRTADEARRGKSRSEGRSAGGVVQNTRR